MRRMLPLLFLALQAQAQSDLELRVKRLEERLSSDVLAQMYQRLLQLEEEVKRLRGEVARLHELERRLSEVEGELQNLKTSGPSLPEEVVPEGASGPADPALEEKEYRRALSLLEAGHYDEAIAAFQSFLRRFPEGRYAPNGYYWLGEAFYAQRQFGEAKEAFRAVLERFPESPKRGDALLKLGFVAYEEGDYQEAKRLLTQVAQEYAGTRLARLALRRLDEMRQKRLIR